jgi:K+/H+ antiporter YhaU regulatory subunit KhtT
MTRPKPADNTPHQPEPAGNPQSHDTVIVYDCDNNVLGRYESNVPLTDEEVRRIGAAVRKAYEAPRLQEKLNSIDHQLASLQKRKAEIGKKLGEASGRRDTPHKPHREKK